MRQLKYTINDNDSLILKFNFAKFLQKNALIFHEKEESRGREGERKIIFAI